MPNDEAKADPDIAVSDELDPTEPTVSSPTIAVRPDTTIFAD